MEARVFNQLLSAIKALEAIKEHLSKIIVILASSDSASDIADELRIQEIIALEKRIEALEENLKHGDTEPGTPMGLYTTLLDVLSGSQKHRKKARN